MTRATAVSDETGDRQTQPTDKNKPSSCVSAIRHPNKLVLAALQKIVFACGELLPVLVVNWRHWRDLISMAVVMAKKSCHGRSLFVRGLSEILP